MKSLEQLRQLQKLLEDGVMSQEEFDSQKKIVVLSLNSFAWNSDSESEPNLVCWLIVIMQSFSFNTSYFVYTIWSTYNN